MLNINVFKLEEILKNGSNALSNHAAEGTLDYSAILNDQIKLNSLENLRDQHASGDRKARSVATFCNNALTD